MVDNYGTRSEWVVFFIFIGWLHWPHANSLSEKLGQSSDRNDVLEWTDGFQSPMLSCPEEPSGRTLDETKQYHQQHIPRQCHLKISKFLLEKAETRGDYEHALYHQVLSGRGVDYYLAYHFVRPEWRPFLQKDKDRISYNVVKNNAELFANNVYKTTAGVKRQVERLDSVYEMYETERKTRRELMVPLIMLGIILWFINFFLDNGMLIARAIRRIGVKRK